MKRLPVLAVVCVAALAASGCKKTGSAGADEPQQAGLLREVEEQAAEDLECPGDGEDGDEDDGDEEDGDEDEEDGDDEDGDDEDDDDEDDGDSGITVRWVDGGYLAEGCGRQVRYEVDCVGEPGEEVCSISLDDGKDDEGEDVDGDDGDDGDEDEDEEEAREARDEEDAEDEDDD